MTLVEVMIALLITVVALLGSLAMIGSLLLSSSFSRNYTEASVLAQSKLESWVSYPYTSLPTTINTANAPSPTTEYLDALGNTAPQATATYTRQSTWAPSSDSLRWVVTVSVKWTDGRGVSHYVYAARQKDGQ